MDAILDPEARWAAAAEFVEEAPAMRSASLLMRASRHLVIALNASGLPTTASCEGHLDWGTLAPWVDVRPAPTRASVALHQELNTIDREIGTIVHNDPDAAALDALYEKRRLLLADIRRPTLALARDLTTLLAAFYRDQCVPYDQMISLNVRFIGFRMQCHGSEVQHMATGAAKFANLKRYQAEMHAFAAFLQHLRIEEIAE